MARREQLNAAVDVGDQARRHHDRGPHVDAGDHVLVGKLLENRTASVGIGAPEDDVGVAETRRDSGSHHVAEDLVDGR